MHKLRSGRHLGGLGNIRQSEPIENGPILTKKLILTLNFFASGCWAVSCCNELSCTGSWRNLAGWPTFDLFFYPCVSSVLPATVNTMIITVDQPCEPVCVSTMTWTHPLACTASTNHCAMSAVTNCDWKKTWIGRFIGEIGQHFLCGTEWAWSQAIHEYCQYVIDKGCS